MRVSWNTSVFENGKKIRLLFFTYFFGNFCQPLEKKTPNSQLKTAVKYCTLNALFLICPWLKHLPVCKKQHPCLIVGSSGLTWWAAGKAFKERLWLPCDVGIPRLAANQPRTGETLVDRCEKRAVVGIDSEGGEKSSGGHRQWGWRVELAWRGAGKGGRVRGPARTSCSEQWELQPVPRRELLSLLLLPTSGFCEALEIASGGDLACHCWTREALW